MTDEKKWKRQYIKDLKDGSVVRGRFAVWGKEAPRDYRYKDGKYFTLEVGDKTGRMTLKYWGGADGERVTDLYNKIKMGTVLSITGVVSTGKYDNEPMINLNEGQHIIQICEREEDEEKEFIPKTDKDVEVMFRYIYDRASSVKNKNLLTILHSFLNDEKLMSKFKLVPGSVKGHYSYISGTIEHTWAVLNIVDCICNIYSQLNRELLITGAILHDIGKVEEYTYATVIEPTDRGRFLGHIQIGCEMLIEKIRGIDKFPQDIEMKLIHMLILHHEDEEKRFKIPEACALNYAVQLDRNVKEYVQILKKGDGEWIASPELGTMVYSK